MTSQPTSTSVSPYHAYRQPSFEIVPGLVFHDRDGTILYEDAMCASLLLKIIETHDDEFLKRYLEISPRGLGLADVYLWDPFYVVANCGTANALNMMLECWAADPSRCWPAPDERDFDLLDTACRSGKLDKVRLLTDTSLPWAARFGNIHRKAEADSRRHESALMVAAGSYRDLPYGTEARRESEELVHYLLDMGACAKDDISGLVRKTCPSDPGSRPDEDEPQTVVDEILIWDTVLTLAIRGASSDMVRRLVEEGVDVHTKVAKGSGYMGRHFGGPRDIAQEVTALHIGSFHFNAEVIQALFDNRGGEVSVKDMVSCRDDYGRTPLHWATGSDIHVLSQIPDDDDTNKIITSKATSTIKLLLAGNPEIVNARDNRGDTPLYYAVRTYHRYTDSICPWHYEVIKALCDGGADMSARDNRGQTPLHESLRLNIVPQPSDAALIALLLEHGANVSDVDAGGNTAVHFAARNLQLVELVRVLLDHAGCSAEDILRAVDAEGNTPLHIAASLGNMRGKPEERMRGQEEMMRVLLPPIRGGGGEGEGLEGRDGASGLSLMDQRNAAGDTPRQLREERWRRWRQDHAAWESYQAAYELWRRRMEAGVGQGQNPAPRRPSGIDFGW